ncbi:MAG: DNA internalization-related competence protein ComEC/Rec2 [Cellulosilyticaceae bacterium]
MKKSLQTHHRPVIFISIFFILGIIGGSIRQEVPYATLFIVLVAMSIGMISWWGKSSKWLGLLGIFLLGAMRIVMSDQVSQGQLERQMPWVMGTIQEVRPNTYGTQLLVGDLQGEKEGKPSKLYGKVVVRIGSQGEYEVGDVIQVYGVPKAPAPQMNPSDMDYCLYLKGERVWAEVQATKIVPYGKGRNIPALARKALEQQIDKVFAGKDQGVVTSLLVGVDDGMPEDVREMYNRLGIGHVLAVSGLHIGLIFGGAWWLLKGIVPAYKKRAVYSLGVIWLYALLVGFNTSVVRACIVLTIIYIGRVLWEEEDLLISLAIAALVLLSGAPYQLFQVGFQLSFVAYLGIILVMEMSRRCKIVYGKSPRKHPMFFACLSQGVLTWVLLPVLSWHFFEVPVLGNLLNFVVIPLYSLLLPLCLGVVALSMIALPVAQWLGLGISWVIQGMHVMGELCLELPLATWITGKPSLMTIVCYYGLGIVGILYFFQWKHRKLSMAVWGICAVMIMAPKVLEQPLLEVTHLYVGQGDGAIIITPTKKAILIDGGPVGKEKVMAKYLKYRGIREVESVIVSHGHEDHIGGIIGLVEEGIPIKRMMMPEMVIEKEWQQQLQALCQKEEIPYITLDGNEQMTVDGVRIQCFLAGDQVAESNDRSAVCLVQYGAYKQLFTGDMTQRIEEKVVEDLPEVTALKVAHHGSKTSSSQKFLDHMAPNYGIISSGINNRYNHPNPQVMDRLEQKGVQALRTDTQGAISFVTDGTRLKVVTHIQEEDRNDDEGDPVR